MSLYAGAKLDTRRLLAQAWERLTARLERRRLAAGESPFLSCVRWLRRQRCAHQANLVERNVMFASGFKRLLHGSKTDISESSCVRHGAIAPREHCRANFRLSLWRNEPIQIDHFALCKSLAQVVHYGARRQSPRLRNLVHRLSILKELPRNLRRPDGSGATCPLTTAAVVGTLT